jgi:hypothetical protein
MLLGKFSPPANLNELSPNGLEQWSTMLSDLFDQAAAGPPEDPTDSPRAQFFNPLKTEIADDEVVGSTFWTAFPKTVMLSTPVKRERWEKADADRALQDEYCEWAVERTADNKVRRVTFTCEVPEYWDAIAADSHDRLLALYRELAGPRVQLSDLIDQNGSYIRENVWNRGQGVPPVHMTQGSNTLGAAVELAAAATIVREINGRKLTSEQELIKCSRYGVRTRNSDPHIGASINELAREKAADVALADPLGLYLNDLMPAGFTTPDGTNAKTFWKVTRGEPGLAVRGVYEVPAEKGYVVGDITIEGEPVEFGGQLADFLSVKIIATACRIGKTAGKPFNVCRHDPQ